MSPVPDVFSNETPTMSTVDASLLVYVSEVKLTSKLLFNSNEPSTDAATCPADPAFPIKLDWLKRKSPDPITSNSGVSIDAPMFCDNPPAETINN